MQHFGILVLTILKQVFLWTGHGIFFFGRGVELINFRVASNGSNASIEVHLNSPDGKIIGKMDVVSTGGWQK
ncbi:MAG: carbohydrate-binding protein [Ruminococcus sp.]|nr:carbohydrate-binding protein [Ruminococcus sp.]